MSRIGRMPIAIPDGVTVTIAENNQVTVKAPRGHTPQATLRLTSHPARAQTGVPGCGNKPALPP